MIKLLKNTHVFILLSLALFTLYLRTLPYPFQFDDFNVIVHRDGIHSLSAWWQSMPGMRPLLKLSYALNWQFDAQPRFFRLFNLVCHLLSSVLVMVLVHKLLPYLVNSIENIQRKNIAWFTAFLFALHPAHSEVVIYISSRSMGLMGLLSLAALIFYFNWLTDKHASLNRLVLAILLWFAAVLVKEVALMLPLLALWVTYWVAPNQFSFFKQASILHKLLLLGILLLPVIWLLSIPQYARLLTDFTQAQMNQLLNQPFAHVHYLTNTLFGIGLNIDYPNMQPTALSKALSSLVLLALISIAWVKRKQWPMLGFAFGWWLICLLPTNSVIYRPDLVNDRQIYLASIGPILLFSFVLLRLVRNVPKAIKVTLLISPLLYFSANTLQRTADYQSEISLWQASLRQNRFNARAWNNLGYAYQLAGEKTKAKDCYENALVIDQKHQKAKDNLQILTDGFYSKK